MRFHMKDLVYYTECLLSIFTNLQTRGEYLTNFKQKNSCSLALFQSVNQYEQYLKTFNIVCSFNFSNKRT